MTQIQISKYLDIPLTTLNDWKKENSNRNKLYQLLINLDKNEVESKLNKKANHRFFHILNRNINDETEFKFEDIKKHFLKTIIMMPQLKNKQFMLSFLKS